MISGATWFCIRCTLSRQPWVVQPQTEIPKSCLGCMYVLSILRSKSREKIILWSLWSNDKTFVHIHAIYEDPKTNLNLWAVPNILLFQLIQEVSSHKLRQNQQNVMPPLRFATYEHDLWRNINFQSISLIPYMYA